jgi:transcriptional regulator with XRE-family HTH domain
VVDDIRFGGVVRAIRVRRGWTQAELATRADVSRAAVSPMERGHLGRATFDLVRSVCAALDVRVEVTARWRGGELDRFLDRGHAATSDSVIAHLKARGWICHAEASFSVYGDRGSVDILAWHLMKRTVLVVEIKTALVDLQDLAASVDRKVRLAPRLAGERGWNPAVVGAWVVVADGRTSRRRLADHRNLLRASFPDDGRRMREWLRRPGQSIRALSFWPNARVSNARPSKEGRRRLRGPSGERGDPVP